MSANGTEARVHALPKCDFCKDTDTTVEAAYDGRTPYGWAYMCEAHWTEHGPGRVGLGNGQRLVVDTEPEDDPDCIAAPKATYESFMQDSLAGDELPDLDLFVDFG